MALLNFLSSLLAHSKLYFVLRLLKIRGRNIKIGTGLVLSGAPILILKKSSQLMIGSNCTLLSRLRSNGLGIQHPVIFYTLRESSEIVIGNNVGISGGAFCATTSIRIGNNSLLGANVTIADSDFHPINPDKRRSGSNDVATAAITIGDNVFIGTGCIILKGVTIGDDSVIGAGSVVTRDIPAGVIAAGNPCIVIRNARG
jgi:acetyltransferase-like isoleucine patch superfamily enzyme